VTKTQSAGPISCLEHRATRVLHCAIVPSVKFSAPHREEISNPVQCSRTTRHEVSQVTCNEKHIKTDLWSQSRLLLTASRDSTTATMSKTYYMMKDVNVRSGPKKPTPDSQLIIIFNNKLEVKLKMNSGAFLNYFRQIDITFEQIFSHFCKTICASIIL